MRHSELCDCPDCVMEHAMRKALEEIGPVFRRRDHILALTGVDIHTGTIEQIAAAFRQAEDEID